MQRYYAIGVGVSIMLHACSLYASESFALPEKEIILQTATLVRAPFKKLPLSSDKQAYEYCVDNKKSFVAIVWPIAQGKDKEIERIFKKYGKLLYYKKARLNSKKAFYLLQKAHPHIVDMFEHVDWYFPQGTFEKPARLFVLEFDNAETAVACKMAIRGLYHLQYRSIHINDTHEETKELAEFFFK